MSEYRELFISYDIASAMRAECNDLLEEGVRDFVSVVQHLIGRCDLSLYDVRTEVEGCYNTVREERAAAGQDVSGMTSLAEVADAAAWLQRWISHPSHLYSPKEKGWGA